MHITKPLHTAILVSDLKRSEQFYGSILGLSKINRTLKYPGAWYQVGDYQIHLIVDLTTPNGLHNAEKWGRNRHIAFLVDNLQSAQTQLRNHGCDVQLSTSGRAALFTHDPDGNVIELAE
jgi:glyoxylase I family protein